MTSQDSESQGTEGKLGSIQILGAPWSQAEMVTNL